ncbi:MAG: sn-glycerol-1-phosphate dehydrogenase, partial [Clostridiales bacterium]|nr:sn-glycerol-1-phosphate dehydrogenase [Clostridiales bacterium]
MEQDFLGCSCGREHVSAVKTVEVAKGYLARTAEILTAYNFPRKLLLVADDNTIAAAEGVIACLEAGGFSVVSKIYRNLRVASMTQVETIEALCRERDAILSVGTGSLNDICRLAAYR